MDEDVIEIEKILEDIEILIMINERKKELEP